MRVKAASIVLGLVLLASGCGGGSNGKTASVKSDSPSGTIDAKGFASADCQGALRAMAGVTGSLPQAMSGAGGDLTQAFKSFDEYAKKAPKAIRADMMVMADAYGKMAKILADAHYDPTSGKPPSAAAMQKLQSIGSAFDDAKYKAAATHVGAYFSGGCK
jgi:hypothetical protein